MPCDPDQIETIDRSFHRSIQGVFISTLEIMIYHTLITWLIFDSCNVQYVYLLSLFAGLITLLPIISPLIVLIPGNLIDIVHNDPSIVKLVILNISYYLLITITDIHIYKKNVRMSNPYVTGLSFVTGVYTFGLKGLIYGPALLCVSTTVIDIMKIMLK